MEESTMIKLYKFYELISRNATVTIASDDLRKTFFEGNTKDIPDNLDNCTVADFTVSNDGDFLFMIKK